MFLSTISFNSVQLWLKTQRYWFRIPPGRMCVIEVVHTVPEIVQRPGVLSVVYGAVHYEEPLKSFDKSIV